MDQSPRNLNMWRHGVLEYQDCSNSDLLLTLIFLGNVKYGKMLEYKISWKVLKNFAQECSNDDQVG